MADAKPEAAGEAKAGAKFDPKKILLGAFIAVDVLVLAGGAGMAYMGTLGFHRPSVREPAAMAALKKERETEGVRESVLYTMPTFTVNLAGQPRRMIRVEMTLEMLDKEGFEEVVTQSPAARDAIVRILNEKTYDDLETIQGKLFLKDEITVALNKELKEGVVKDVFYNEFLVQ